LADRCVFTLFSENTLLDTPLSDSELASSVVLQSPAEAKTGPLVVLSGGGPLPWIIINAVAERFGPVTVLEEKPEPASLMFRRRLRKLGAVEVAGQIAFGILQRTLRFASRRRLAEITARHSLVPTPAPDCTVIEVGSVNSDVCRRELARLEPAVVLVIGTRIIGRDTLATVPARFINYHAGINPKYRGMCGGYWALTCGEPENFGVTVHLVDHGVDTGDVLHWETIAPDARDNFATYPMLLAVAGRSAVLKVLGDALEGRIDPVRREMNSRQWYHPTLWGYLWTGISRKVW
jgi:folate-dependent phosphoribosylglycinamide formyltransferase PurN